MHSIPGKFYVPSKNKEAENSKKLNCLTSTTEALKMQIKKRQPAQYIATVEKKFTAVEEIPGNVEKIDFHRESLNDWFVKLGLSL